VKRSAATLDNTSVEGGIFDIEQFGDAGTYMGYEPARIVYGFDEDGKPLTKLTFVHSLRAEDVSLDHKGVPRRRERSIYGVLSGALTIEEQLEVRFNDLRGDEIATVVKAVHKSLRESDEVDFGTVMSYLNVLFEIPDSIDEADEAYAIWNRRVEYLNALHWVTDNEFIETPQVIIVEEGEHAGEVKSDEVYNLYGFNGFALIPSVWNDPDDSVAPVRKHTLYIRGYNPEYGAAYAPCTEDMNLVKDQ
jgi:hypothetical protein